jgi:AcrR family transcriptional regulator
MSTVARAAEAEGGETARKGSGRLGRLPRAQRVGEIEAAARTVFCRHGYTAASIAEIAAEAGIAEGTIYKFFESKQQLLGRVIQIWYESMLEVFDRGLGGLQGARNRIRFIIWQHLTSLREDVKIARLCVDEVLNAGKYYRSELYQLNRRYTRVLIDACRDGVASGELRADTPITLVRDMIFGGLDHHCSAMLRGHSDVDPDKSADLIVDFVFSGIASHPPGGTSQREEAAIRRIELAASRLEHLASKRRAPLRSAVSTGQP